jgi:ketosteroid isomerase-like protein
VGQQTPDEVVGDFGAALRAGDVGAATALFSREGCFVTPDSTVIHGRSEIRGFLQQLVDMAEELTIEQRTMLRAGDVAVGSESWSMRMGRGADAVRRITRSTIVLSRIEGVWRIAVVDPWRA